MQLFKKFAGIALFFFLFLFFAHTGTSRAEPQEEGRGYFVMQAGIPPLSAETRAFLESLHGTLYMLENGFYYGLSPEARAKMFARIREVLNEELATLDIHTTLIPPSSVREFEERRQGEFSGIGTSIMVHPDDNKAAKETIAAFVKKMTEKYGDAKGNVSPLSLTAEETREYQTLVKAAGIIGAHGIVIKEVFPGSPAEKAGITAGSILHSIDGTTVIGMSLTDAVNLIKGKVGTNVTLGISTGSTGHLEIVITRETVDVPLVQSASHKVTGLDGAVRTIGYVKILEFQGRSAEQFSEEVTKLVKAGAGKLIIDVRGNPGGSITIVSEILASIMPPRFVILYSETKDGATREPLLTARDIPRIFAGDIVVLVDGDSASASEILAGALQDHKFATIIGERTRGKGSMQGVFHLPDGSIVKLTVALYKTPSGKAVDKVGIEPDIKAKDDPKTLEDEVFQTALNFLANR